MRVCVAVANTLEVLPDVALRQRRTGLAIWREAFNSLIKKALVVPMKSLLDLQEADCLSRELSANSSALLGRLCVRRWLGVESLAEPQSSSRHFPGHLLTSTSCVWRLSSPGRKPDSPIFSSRKTCLF